MVDWTYVLLAGGPVAVLLASSRGLRLSRVALVALLLAALACLARAFLGDHSGFVGTVLFVAYCLALVVAGADMLRSRRLDTHR